ncbi:Kinesin-like protein KIN-4A [Stylosanthes scabra]|uniref:Kinesin-like protein KIN-4A n=1 Tax=Stylosanthes scabra TaxID=79078 RepID=A0ABU6Y4G2_9FABA|nr:Kinesin-like protein KIN-4A [Stylosanthes scabra]
MLRCPRRLRCRQKPPQSPSLQAEVVIATSISASEVAFVASQSVSRLTSSSRKKHRRPVSSSVVSSPAPGPVENLAANFDGQTQKLEDIHAQKLKELEAQLKKKQESQVQLTKQKQKSDETTKKLQDEIQAIKAQKVQLQHRIKQEAKQFRQWKASREKELLQFESDCSKSCKKVNIKNTGQVKEGRRNEYERHKLQALNQRQKMVLQRKTEEAAMATKRLKELLEARKASSRDTSASKE